MTQRETSRVHIPFHLHLGYFFIGLMTLFIVLTTWYAQSSTSKILAIQAHERFAAINASAVSQINQLYGDAKINVELLADQPITRATSLDARLASLNYLVTALRSHASLMSIYIGYDNGDFILLRPWRNEAPLRARFNPPAQTAWIVQSIEVVQGKPLGLYLFYDQHLKLIEKRRKADYQFDARVRPWYVAAKGDESAHSTSPYVFFSTEKVGVTVSQSSTSQQSVVGVDVSLDKMSEILSQAKGTPGSRFALLTDETRVMATHQGAPALRQTADGALQLPRLEDYDGAVLRVVRDQYANMVGKVFAFQAANDTWEGNIQAIPVVGGAPLQLWMASPHAEMLAPAIEIRNKSLLISAVLLLIGISVALWLARMASRPLAQLNVEAQRIARFEFNEPIHVDARITEVVQLSNSMGQMKDTIERFLALSHALASETNFKRLLVRIVSEMREVTDAQGGVIYLANANMTHLEIAEAQFGNSVDAFTAIPDLELQANSAHPVVQMLNNDENVRALSSQQIREHFDFLISDSESYSLISLPLKNKNGDLLGVLALFLDDCELTLSPELMSFIQALSGTAAVALNTQRLVEEQKTLLEAFIKLLAGAIDAKSPYTGGHCQRVPELTKMLANAACQVNSGTYADFSLNDEEREALHIACWLHDCGKVTTPEYVVDKATKLETLYDRIHEVRMRFEVLKRDAELAALKAQLAGGDAVALQLQLASELAQLDADFAFVAQCNEGGEFMAPEKIARLNAIAERRWLRTLDDRIGISHEEKERKERQPAADLPVLEPLLADKVEHQFERSSREQMPIDNPWGFKMKVPELLYNRGEVYNLAVARGTLSEEERYKINEHIVQTIIMLEMLPFPRHLRQVPEIAGGHHEKMDGTGYPKRLKKDEMSPLARMMAIADIFEALTAVDRPYKKGKLLSEAIKIMSFMKKDQHIDPELFELFLSSGVYLQYAQRFMKPDQIDTVDIAAYLTT